MLLFLRLSPEGDGGWGRKRRILEEKQERKAGVWEDEEGGELSKRRDKKGNKPIRYCPWATLPAVCLCVFTSSTGVTWGIQMCGG